MPFSVTNGFSVFGCFIQFTTNETQASKRFLEYNPHICSCKKSSKYYLKLPSSCLIHLFFCYWFIFRRCAMMCWYACELDSDLDFRDVEESYSALQDLRSLGMVKALGAAIPFLPKGGMDTYLRRLLDIGPLDYIVAQYIRLIYDAHEKCWSDTRCLDMWDSIFQSDH